MGEYNDDCDDYDDITCCHQITFCHPLIRNIIVTNPVFKNFKLQLTWADLFWLGMFTFLVLLGWTVLFLIMGNTMLPWKDGFSLYFLAIFAYSLGWSLSYIPYLNLPPVLGMLLAGLIVRNTGLYNIRQELGLSTTTKIRTFCLTFIMIRAGLQLSVTTLTKHPTFILTLATVPCSIEMFVSAMCYKALLLYSWDWAFMTGAILACMSPVVTLSGILALAEKGYGEDKGLTTLLCTAACIDDVHILSIFVVCYSIVFANGKNSTEWWFYIPAGFRDIIVGTLAGIILGVCFVFLPHRSHKYATFYRMIGLVLGALVCTIVTTTLTISGGGYIASVVMSFIAITGWRTLSTSFNTAPFRQVSYVLWNVVQPIFNGVIGADIDFTDWYLHRFALHLVCIFIGLMTRSIVTYATTLQTSFTWKERLFVVVAWLPKGTLQAALGPLAYERVHNNKDFEKIEMALDIVKISVVTILLMAPLGAFLMAFTGPILLNKITIEEQEKQHRLSYLRILSLQPDDTHVKRRNKSSSISSESV